MDWEKSPKLKEFAESFADYLKDVGCMDNPEGWMGSHEIVSRINVLCVDEDEDIGYEVCGLEYDQLMGCGCPADITIKIRRVNDNT